MMTSGAYMETFRIGDKVVTNGHLIEQPEPSSHSTTEAQHHTSRVDEKNPFADQNEDVAASDSHDEIPPKEGFGRRLSGFLKKISPAERAQQKAMAASVEEEARNAKKYPMSEGTYNWEIYDPSKARET